MKSNVREDKTPVVNTTPTPSKKVTLQPKGGDEVNTHKTQSFLSFYVSKLHTIKYCHRRQAHFAEANKATTENSEHNDARK